MLPCGLVSGLLQTPNVTAAEKSWGREQGTQGPRARGFQLLPCAAVCTARLGERWLRGHEVAHARCPAQHQKRESVNSRTRDLELTESLS